MAHKKGQGSSRNGRDSVSKRLGVKTSDGQAILSGGIILFPAPPQSTDVVAAFLPLSNGHVVMKRALGGADGGMWE